MNVVVDSCGGGEFCIFVIFGKKQSVCVCVCVCVLCVCTGIIFVMQLSKSDLSREYEPLIRVFTILDQ